MALSVPELAASTSIAVRTPSRRKRQGRLHTDESERLYPGFLTISRLRRRIGRHRLR